MGKMEQMVLESAQEGAAGSDSALGAKLLESIREGRADPKMMNEALRQEMGATTENTNTNKQDMRQENKVALAEEAVELKKIQDRLKIDVARIERDKKIATQEIAEIKTRIKDAAETGQPNIAKNWEIRLKKAKDFLEMIEKTSPSIEPFSGEEILKEVKEYKRARHAQEQAELRVNRGEDPKANGDYLRAENEAFAISQKIEELVKKNEEATLSKVPTEAANDSIYYTKEQADADKAEFEKKHTPAQGGEETQLTDEQSTLDKEAREQEQREYKGAHDIFRIKKEGVAQQETKPSEKKILPTLKLELVNETPKTTKETGMLEFDVVNEPQITQAPETRKYSAGEIEKIKEIVNKTHAQALEDILRIDKEVEERIERIEAQAEKKGLLEKVRAVAEKYNKIPTHYKLLFAGGLILSGAGAAVVGSAVAGGAVATLGVASRTLAGAGLFWALEKKMHISHERKTGKPITEEAAARQTIIAATLAIMVASLFPTVAHNVLELVDPTEAFASTEKPIPNKQAVTGVVSPTVEEYETALENERLASYVAVAKHGDSIWKMAEQQLETHYGEKFTDLPTEKQTYLINAVKEQVAQHAESFGMTDANKLSVGQSIDFGQILNNKEFMDEQFVDIEEINKSVEELAGHKTLENEPVITTEHEEINPKETPTETAETKVVEEKIATIEQPQTTATIIEEAPTLGAVETHLPPKMIPEIATHPEILTQANEQVRNIIKEVFGSKGGFLGFGADDGTKIFSIFADKTVDEITRMDVTSTEAPTENTEKLRDLLAQARAKTGVEVMPRETVGDYLHRATATAIANSKLTK